MQNQQPTLVNPSPRSSIIVHWILTPWFIPCQRHGDVRLKWRLLPLVAKVTKQGSRIFLPKYQSQRPHQGAGTSISHAASQQHDPRPLFHNDQCNDIRHRVWNGRSIQDLPRRLAHQYFPRRNGPTTYTYSSPNRQWVRLQNHQRQYEVATIQGHWSDILLGTRPHPPMKFHHLLLHQYNPITFSAWWHYGYT